MDRCKGCKHWDEFGDGGDSPFGFCKREPDEEGQDAEIVGIFTVGPLYGCVHFEAKGHDGH